jgi:hypothetical protein
MPLLSIEALAPRTAVPEIIGFKPRHEILDSIHEILDSIREA